MNIYIDDKLVGIVTLNNPKFNLKTIINLQNLIYSQHGTQNKDLKLINEEKNMLNWNFIQK